MNINMITNLAGMFVGIPEVIQGVTQAIAGDWTHAVVSISTGIGAFVMAYFVGKPTTA